MIVTTTQPYKELPHTEIQYTVCEDYDHVSRYNRLRQVIWDPDSTEREITLEMPEGFASNVEVVYHKVTHREENRLDLIAFRYLGDPTYSWVISYFNGIADGYTVLEGQTLRIPKFLTSLFDKGEVLSMVNPFNLNLGRE